MSLEPSTGIRFYKAMANTGTHVANLWSSTGTLLATATFAGETASGWQQVNFTPPGIAITPTTSFYVASYHTNVGHYSATQFPAVGGVDNAPLHALANSVSANGVYRYGASSAFPNLTFAGSNYWVDVVFQPGPAPTLSSIAVTPANPSIGTGTTQQFTATGTYSDGSTQNITSQATWTSSSPAATIDNQPSSPSRGLATGVSAGTTTITAALSGISGITTLAVQAAQLTITTNSLSNGTTSVSYSATLAASGGTLPYSWSIVPGLGLGFPRG